MVGVQMWDRRKGIERELECFGLGCAALGSGARGSGCGCRVRMQGGAMQGANVGVKWLVVLSYGLSRGGWGPNR